MKDIYVITTEGCASCTKMVNRVNIVDHNTRINTHIYDFKDEAIPEFIKVNCKLTDFPVTIFTYNNVIKNIIVGTCSKKQFDDYVGQLNALAYDTR